MAEGVRNDVNGRSPWARIKVRGGSTRERRAHGRNGHRAETSPCLGGGGLRPECSLPHKGV